MYHLDTIDYPDEPLCLGKYLGPAIDVGPAMTAKILQHNGKVVYLSMYHPLIVEDWADPTVQQRLVTFSETAEGHLGARVAGTELEEVGIPDTPEYVPYADEDQNEMTFPDLDKEVTPEVGYEYVHLLVMLPHGSGMMSGTLKVCK